MICLSAPVFAWQFVSKLAVLKANRKLDSIFWRKVMEKKNKFGLSAGVATAITWFGFHCGSGFATGRQIVQYVSRHGWPGFWIPIGIWILLSIAAYYCIEYAYLTRSKDYKDFANGFYAPIGSIMTIIWDAIVALASFVALGSVIATAGELFVSAFGFNYWVGVAIFTALMLVCVIWGYNIITKIASIVTIPMIALMVIVIIVGLSHNFENLKQVAANSAIAEGDSVKSMIQDTFTYAGNQVNFLPAFIAISFGFTSERDVKIGAFGGAFLNFIMHFSMSLLCLSAYPWVNDEPLVVLKILEQIDMPILPIIYQIVIFLALVSTAVTMVFGAISRFGVYGKKIFPADRSRKAFWAFIFLVGSVFVSSFGLVTIVSKGYKLLGTLKLPVMLIPIIVLGPWRVHQARNKKKLAEAK